MSVNDHEISLFRINNQQCSFSFNSKYFALAVEKNLFVKEALSFETVHTFSFDDIIESFQWSPNSEFILCMNTKTAVIRVFSIHTSQWKCKLTEGSIGLIKSYWTMDSKHIITFSNLNVQISIWSLEYQTVTYIKNLKSNVNNSLYLNPNGEQLAVIVTDNGNDNIEIYRTVVWKMSRKLICERLKRIDGLNWSPNGQYLAIWCSISDEPKVIIYSIVTEKDVAVLQPCLKIKGDSDYNYINELKGIENVKWAPSGQFLVITGYNEMIILINSITWKPIQQLYFDPVIKDGNYLNKVYVEKSFHNENKASHSARVKHYLHEEHSRPINIVIGAKNNFDSLMIAKTDILKFSRCGRYLAIKHDIYPTTLWIWDIVINSIDYLLLENAITEITWSPLHPRLLVFFKCSYMVEWNPKNSKCIQAPNNITILNAQWHPEGNLVALCGYNKAVIYHMKH